MRLGIIMTDPGSPSLVPPSACGRIVDMSGLPSTGLTCEAIAADAVHNAARLLQ